MKTIVKQKNALLITALLLSASIVFAQKTETYSGSMILPSDIVKIDLRSNDYKPGETKGVAKYGYYTNAEGKRVKHGKFEFSFKTYSGGIFNEIIIGQYTNNKKTGTWKFVNGGGISAGVNGTLVATSKENTKAAEFTYVDDVRTGKFSAIIDPGNHGMVVYYLTGTLSEGYPVGKMQVKVFGLFGEEGTLDASFDDNGLPCGVWKYSIANGGSYDLYTFEEGLISKVQSYDNSTGEMKTSFDRVVDEKLNEVLTEYHAFNLGNQTYYFKDQGSPIYQIVRYQYGYTMGLEDYDSNLLNILLTVFNKLSLDVGDKIHIKKALVDATEKYTRHSFFSWILSDGCDSIISEYNRASAYYDEVSTKCRNARYTASQKAMERSQGMRDSEKEMYAAIDKMLIEEYHPFEIQSVDRQRIRRLEYVVDNYQENVIEVDKEKALKEIENLQESTVSLDFLREHYETICNLDAKAIILNEVAEQQDKSLTSYNRIDSVIEIHRNDLTRKQKKTLRGLVDKNDLEGIITFFENPDNFTK